MDHHRRDERRPVYRDRDGSRNREESYEDKDRPSSREHRRSDTGYRHDQYYRRDERDRDRTRHRSRSRSPTRSSATPTRNRSRSPDSRYQKHRSDRDNVSKDQVVHKLPVDFKETSSPAVKTFQDDINMQEIIAEEGDEDDQLSAFLGFSGFSSTKGQKVRGNANNGAVDGVKKRREYRQYLFVKGAYDIPLTKEQLEAKGREQRAMEKEREHS